MSTPREGNSNFSLFAVQQLLPRLRAHRNALSVAAVALVISAAIGLAFPLLVRHLMDAAFESRDASALNSIAILLLGIFAAQALMNYVMVFDWPMNFGGKPFFAWPSFIPITFELMVLFAAIGLGVAPLTGSVSTLLQRETPPELLGRVAASLIYS